MQGLYIAIFFLSCLGLADIATTRDKIPESEVKVKFYLIVAMMCILGLLTCRI
jgi:hypothetical protein